MLYRNVIYSNEVMTPFRLPEFEKALYLLSRDEKLIKNFLKLATVQMII